jgi:hypothetical protein
VNDEKPLRAAKTLVRVKLHEWELQRVCGPTLRAMFAEQIGSTEAVAKLRRANGAVVGADTHFEMYLKTPGEQKPLDGAIVAVMREADVGLMLGSSLGGSRAPCDPNCRAVSSGNPPHHHSEH